MTIPLSQPKIFLTATGGDAGKNETVISIGYYELGGF